MRELGQIVPWDLASHEGRAQMRETLEHSDMLKNGCKKFKSTAGNTIVKTGFGAVTLALVYALWSALGPHFNIGPK